MTLCSEVVIDMYRSSFVPMYRSGTPRCSEMVMYRSGPNPKYHVIYDWTDIWPPTLATSEEQ